MTNCTRCEKPFEVGCPVTKLNGKVVHLDCKPPLTKAQAIAMSAWHLFQLRGTWLEGGGNPFFPQTTVKGEQ